MAERPFQPVPNTPLVADPTGDAIWKRWLQGLQTFLGNAVRGPGSSTDNAVARWNGTTGTFLNNSGVLIDDSNNVSGVVDLTATGNVVINNNSSGNALRITQTGSGNALLVEDSTNPDATPFVIDATGRVLIGVTSTALNAGLQLYSDGTSAPNSNVLASRFSTDAVQGAWAFRKARGTTAAPSSVINGDNLGGVEFQAYDGTSFIYGGTINCQVDGTPGTNDMPTSMYFSVAADGSGSTTTRLKLSTTGNLIAYSSLRVGSTSEPTSTLDVTGTLAVSGIQSNANKIYPGTDAAVSQSAAGIYAGTGAPNNANGNDGDFYFRSDGGVLTTIYQRRAGAWVGVV